ncbi:hypothetical protein ASC94_23655 [Massilia sp. Root418]|uniref:hypothetical protein n=1 Tax=Massilia sp. Root418 TaxID=1736532 RepID=UPI0006F781AD|nr:hypothetical protein [Massilia sp. Root418]KQW88424.1 hypothetical protein ASC94_23655 [Massilia sp. Root418]
MGNINKDEILLMLERMEDELMLAEMDRMACMAEAGAAREALARRADAAMRSCRAVVARAFGGSLLCDGTRKLFDTHAGITLDVRPRGADDSLLTVSLRIPRDGDATLVAERPSGGLRYFSGRLALAGGGEPQLAAMLSQALERALQPA